MAKTSKKDEDVVVTKKAAGKKQQTVRERAEAGSSESRTARVRRRAGAVRTPLKKANVFSKLASKLPAKETRVGWLLRLPGRILLPKFLREAWREIRLVSWPNRKETWRLTIAVFIFAVVFAAIVGVLDYGLDKLFREVILD